MAVGVDLLRPDHAHAPAYPIRPAKRGLRGSSPGQEERGSLTSAGPLLTARCREVSGIAEMLVLPRKQVLSAEACAIPKCWRFLLTW